MHKHYTLLALGDSYTIGEAVELHYSFPYQTVHQLRKKGHDFTAPEIIAKTGWTTGDLQHSITDYLFSARYDFVSLLIGVNNQYQGQDIRIYKDQFEHLLKKSIELTGGKTDHVFVVSIPDYSVTPFAKEKDSEKISREIDEYNNLNKAICIQYKVSYIEITEEGREAGTNAALVAEDALHPSAKEYHRWAKKLAEAVGKLLKK